MLSLDRYAVVGRLVALWAWCLDNALDGCLGDDIDADILADVMGWDASLGRPVELLEALLTAGFLELNADDGRLYIHDWHEHMGRLIEKREQSAERMRNMRARRAASSAATAQGDPSSDTSDDGAGEDEAATRTLRDKRRGVRRVEQSRVE